jgi:hypothetical protein
MVNLYIEEFTDVEEEGATRGLFLTLLNTGILIAPLVAGGLVNTSGFAIDSYYLCDVDGSRGLRNLVHCTDLADGEGAADREIGIWFTEKELVNYRLISEAMLYDVNLDGFTE